MPHELCGISNSRLSPLLSSGPPNGPGGHRVSATRQGVTGTNCKPADAEVAAVLVKETFCGERAAGKDTFCEEQLVANRRDAKNANIVEEEQSTSRFGQYPGTSGVG